MSRLAINPENTLHLTDAKKVQQRQNLIPLVQFMNKVPGYAPNFTDQVNQRLST